MNIESRSIKNLLMIFMTVMMTVSAGFFARTEVYADEETFTITKQPENVTVDYPEGATFHVEVDHPENVASYHWSLSDGYTVFELDGDTSSTDTLVIPWTDQNPNTFYLCCTITDKNGHKIFTEDAELNVGNVETNKPVLYLGDIALEPGESADLSDGVQGSGKISYDANGTLVTFEDVHFHNDISIYDTTLQSLGIFLSYRRAAEPEYTFFFKGENVIDNTYYDPDYNAAGVCLNSFFGQEENKSTLIIDGDGSLLLKGGSNSIYSDGNLELKMDLETRPLEGIYNDAITAWTILVDEGVHLDLHPNGTGIRARGDLRTYKDSVIDIDSIAPHVSVGPTVKYIVNVDGGMYMESTKLNIKGNAKPETFEPYSSYLVNFTGIGFNGLGGLNAKDSAVDIELHCEKGEDIYALNFCGIVGGENSSSLELEDASSVDIRIDADNVFGTTGILMPGDVNVGKDSKIHVDLKSLGEVSAIEADRAIVFTDCSVDTSVLSLDESGTYGIVSSDIGIELNDPKYYISSMTGNGVGLAADTGERSEDVKPQDNYTPTVIKLSGKAEFETPKKAQINLCGLPGYGETMVTEAVYDPSNMEAPANEVKIIVKKDNTLYYAAGAVAAAGVLALVLKNRKK
ncbi:MAG: hypothetical protein K5648_04425 [Erysipelotrichaceae bacterium]|nr:hypothetical protein [Erysipelotrichaceae bacterium]